MSCSLKASNLEFAFRHRKLFSAVSFSVERSNLLHITGPNGVGKSTLLSILAGLRWPSAGTIHFEVDGKEIADRRSHVEYLPAEANGLFCKMGAFENLKFFRSLRGHGSEGIDSELHRWGLGHPLLRRGFPTEKFSTGMKRRLALARLTLSAASCWLLDEPLYGLDDQAIHLFRQTLDRHLQQGMGVIVSHDTTPIADFVTQRVSLSPLQASKALGQEEA